MDFDKVSRISSTDISENEGACEAYDNGYCTEFNKSCDFCYIESLKLTKDM